LETWRRWLRGRFAQADAYQRPRRAKQALLSARDHFLDRNLISRSAADGDFTRKRATTHRIERLGVERLARGASTAFASP
jgi:hypothetical protein